MRYKPFQLESLPQEVRDLASVHRFSYLVFKKGRKRAVDSSFPRLLSAPKVKSKKIYCQLCTGRGRLEELLVSKKGAYEDAK